MPGPRRALIAAALAWGLSAPAHAAALIVDYLGTHVWTGADEDFGGFSGIEMSADGRSYTALSDRATVRWGSIERDSQGRIRSLSTAGRARLQDSSGTKLKPGYLGDAEGLAIDAEGRMYVSFEGLDRIARFDDPDRPAERIPPAPAFKGLVRNAGLEALAVTPEGDILTMPEQWESSPPMTPVWRFRDGTWSTAFRLPRDGVWAPVGADVGPDGKLYVLERDFRGLRGFASRVRRYAMDGDSVGPPEHILTTSLLQFDNLEGIAVWADGQGIRITMISDDNFLFVQRTELVEYRVR
ncbi:esterase-like activity of phytase family protein [Paracoccus salipaludis]|uniref:Phytase-like domain-containing protein n=1 Tax=Paracoccus salipaludis TaxID=2032623 RepID=A0A2A2GK76_9RHOB|nr:esterase-like activity of phytase family protein [Paracoccus salipaludis]PAU97758.1 hypothetical protein CK240_07305 [Paracoccus salipaludis]